MEKLGPKHVKYQVKRRHQVRIDAKTLYGIDYTCPEIEKFKVQLGFTTENPIQGFGSKLDRPILGLISVQNLDLCLISN